MRKTKRVHLLRALDFPTTLEARRPLPLLLLLLLMLLPLWRWQARWWWRRWWRSWWWCWWRTKAPLRTLGAGLPDPTSCPLALLREARIKGRIRDERPVSTMQAVPPLSLRPPGTTRGGRTARGSLALPRGAESRGGALELASVGREPSAGTSGIWIPRWGSRPPVWRTAMPLSSRVGSQSRIADLNPWLSQSEEMPSGGIKDSTTKDSPVIFTRSSSSSQDRSVPGPRWTRPRSFEPVNQQLRHALACNDAIQRCKKSPTTCIDVRPPVARDSILPNTGSNSSANSGLALHCLLSSLGLSLGITRRSLASVLAITHSARKFSHLAPLREGI
jgi:hypothetical protein